MKGRYLVYILLSFSCLFPFSVNAECDYQRKAELSRIASNVQFSYNYDENNNFTVNITNLTDDIYIKYEDYATLYDQFIQGSNEFQMVIPSGLTMKYSIYSKDSFCPDEFIMDKFVSTPKYNLYSESEECKKNPEFKYCQRWMDTTIDQTKFNTELSKYVNSLKSDNDKLESGESVFSIIFNFFKENIIFTVILVLCCFGVGMYIIYMEIYKERKKF